MTGVMECIPGCFESGRRLPQKGPSQIQGLDLGVIEAYEIRSDDASLELPRWAIVLIWILSTEFEIAFVAMLAKAMLSGDRNLVLASMTLLRAMWGHETGARFEQGQRLCGA